MKCSSCNMDENAISASSIMFIEKEILEVDAKFNKLKELYALKNGFTSDNVKKIVGIDKFILGIKLKTIMSNLRQYLKMDPNIKLLTSYFKKYKPNITLEHKLNDLMNLFLKEPTQDRLSNISNEAKEIIDQKNDLSTCVSLIEKKQFIEIENNGNINNPQKIFLCPCCFYQKQTSKRLEKKCFLQEARAEKIRRKYDAYDPMDHKE